MFQWVQGRGATREASEHRRLGQVELHGSAFTSRLIFQPKVDRRGGIDTIGLLAVVDSIQVHLHDVMLGIIAIDLRCEHDLFKLTHNCCLVAHNQILNQLLGNCASTLYRSSTVQVVEAARMIRRMSMPGLVQKFLSSVATVAFTRTGATCSSETVVCM